MSPSTSQLTAPPLPDALADWELEDCADEAALLATLDVAGAPPEPLEATAVVTDAVVVGAPPCPPEPALELDVDGPSAGTVSTSGKPQAVIAIAMSGSESLAKQ